MRDGDVGEVEMFIQKLRNQRLIMSDSPKPVRDSINCMLRQIIIQHCEPKDHSLNFRIDWFKQRKAGCNFSYVQENRIFCLVSHFRKSVERIDSKDALLILQPEERS